MSYYTEVGFIVIFPREQDLTTWLASTALKIQDYINQSADEQRTNLLNDNDAIQRLFASGRCLQFTPSTTNVDDMPYAFKVHTTMKRLPVDYEKILRYYIGDATSFGGAGGYIAIGEDMDDTNYYENDGHGIFNIYDYFQIERSLYEESLGEVVNNHLDKLKVFGE